MSRRQRSEMKSDLLVAQLRVRYGGDSSGAGGRVSLRSGRRRPALAALCVVLLASVVSLAGGGLGASPVLAQDASGPFARIWTKKLASGNVEFGVSVFANPSATPTNPTVSNRYFRYDDVSEGTWYHSEAITLRSGTNSVLVAVRARRLESGNLEFGIRIYDSDDRHWSPAARYFPYGTAAIGQLAYSSAFYLRPNTQGCAGTNNSGRKMHMIFDATTGALLNPGLFRDCQVLLAIKDELAGTPLVGPTSTAISNWTATNNNIASWEGVTLGEIDNFNRVTKLEILRGSRTRFESSATLTGTIPKMLGKLTYLETLDFSDQYLTGEIPAELGNLTNLKELKLKFNRLTGEIPAELGNLTNLEKLDLSEINGGVAYGVPNAAADGGNFFPITAGLTGEIPAELGNLTNLKELSITENNLTGTIPSELGDLTNLTKLKITKNGNNLSGVIPSELGNLTKLEELNLSENGLIGVIPSELGNLTKLKELNLHNNGLTGVIPSELGNLVVALTKLNLSWNKLSGVIPSELGNLTNLKELNLYINKLTAIPPSLGSLSNLQVLDLSWNLLSGPIPSQLGNLASNAWLRIHFHSTAWQSSGNFDMSGCWPPAMNSQGICLRPETDDNPDLSGCVPAALRAKSITKKGGLPWCSS